MPDVQTLTASHVEEARKIASDTGNIAIILPDRDITTVPANDHIDSNKASQINALLGNQTPCNITVVGMTETPEAKPGLLDRLFGRQPETPDITDSIDDAIPFFKYVRDVAGMGNNVIVFEGDDLAVGCNRADAVIVDGGLIPDLDLGWLNTIKNVMTHQPAKVLVFSREGRVQSM